MTRQLTSTNLNNGLQLRTCFPDLVEEGNILSGIAAHTVCVVAHSNKQRNQQVSILKAVALLFL